MGASKRLYNQIQESMIAKVQQVQGAGDWDSPHGKLYSYEYTMSDGTTLKANHKSQNPFPVGTEVDYEITKTNQYGNMGKVRKPESANFQQSTPATNISKDRIIARQSSLKIALDYLLNIGFKDEDNLGKLQELQDVAEILTDYVLSDSNTNIVPTPQKVEKVQQNAPKRPTMTAMDAAEQSGFQPTPDSLPF